MAEEVRPGLRFDPDVARALGVEAGQRLPPAPARSWRAIRAQADAALAVQARGLDPRPDVRRRAVTIPVAGGPSVRGRWYTPPTTAARPHRGKAAVHLHGGGWVAGSVDLYDRVVAAHVAASGAAVLAVDYRLAPEHPHPQALQDSLAGLRWLHEHADGLGVDPARVAVMGDSAGGGLAAGVAQLARAEGLPLARQILVHPALDDRTRVPDPALQGLVTWTWADNATAWDALAGEPGTPADGVPPASATPLPLAPARSTDLSGLAPVHLDVGELDIFRDECLDYARRLSGAGTSVELHVHPGAPHGFDGVAPAAGVSARAVADRRRALQDL